MQMLGAVWVSVMPLDMTVYAFPSALAVITSQIKFIYLLQAKTSVFINLRMFLRIENNRMNKVSRGLGQDFYSLDWDGVERDRALVIFQDRQSGFRRLLEAKEKAFRHMFFQWNWPFGAYGDTLSLKKVCGGEAIFQDNAGRVRMEMDRDAIRKYRKLLVSMVNCKLIQ